MNRVQVNILGIRVDAVTMTMALNRVEAFIRERQPRLVATANAEMVMLAQEDRLLADILNSADLVLADGAGVVWAAKRLGSGVPERVAGFDLTQELLARAAISGYRIFWLGAAPGIAETAAQNAAQRYPELVTVGIHDGYFAPEDQTIIQIVRDARPDILLCALGVPKQEKWLREHLDQLQVPVAIGIGGTFDVMAGKARRAPVWMQRAGLEWSYRLIRQPSRLMRMLALPKFALRVLLTAWTTR